MATAEEDVSEKWNQKDKNHGINEHSHISPCDTIYPASTVEESLGYKMVVRGKLRSSSIELEGLEGKLMDLEGGLMSLDVGLGEAEKGLEQARQKLGDMEEKLNESTPTFLA